MTGNNGSEKLANSDLILDHFFATINMLGIAMGIQLGYSRGGVTHKIRACHKAVQNIFSI